MPRCRFVLPSTTTLHLSDGDWIQVKNQLTVGEERAAYQLIVGEVSNTDEDGRTWRRPNLALMGVAEVAAYLVAWSFLDPQGQPIRPDVNTIQQLDPDTFRELESAIKANVEKMAAEREAAKNVKAGRTDSEQILQSVS